MGSSQAVYIKSGDQPRAFQFGNGVVNSTSTTTNQNSLPIYKESVYSTFQATVKGTGALTATVTIQVSNDDNTGRGYTAPGNTSPGFVCSTVSGSPNLLSPANQFTPNLVGATVVGPGVPVGTTVLTFLSSNNVVMTNNASASGTGSQISMYDNLWCSTAMGVITLSGSNVVSDGFTTQAPWRYVRAAVSNVTGTGATATVNMGV